MRHMPKSPIAAVIAVVLVFAISSAMAGDVGGKPGRGDTLQKEGLPQDQVYLNAWGLNIMVSNDGFGLGGFYRHEFTQDLAGFMEFSISEAKDDQEVEMYNYYTGVTYSPGKLNRFLVIPLIFGAQYRLFREDITDTFRPYLVGGIGPTMVYVMPYVKLQGDVAEQVDFFKAIGMGHPQYGLGSYIGAGAMFGSDKSNVFGLSFRYYMNTLFGAGIPSFYDVQSGQIIKTKKNFGGFAITLSFGLGY
jgi:hypothetical protein